ncbi:MAG: protein translocase subunit SecF [Nanoarchaeota archaeon]
MLDQIKHIYETKYKLFLVLTFIILFAALAQITWQYHTTGDFLHKGVSLKGGITVTIPGYSDTASLETALHSQFSENDLSVRVLRGASGQYTGVLVDADIIETDAVNTFVAAVAQSTGVSRNQMSIETFGSRLSDNFFQQLLLGLLIAFLFMGSVVFLYFRDFVPSIAVMLAAGSDIIITLAIVNILEIKLSTAGIAAFLMLIGYSIDTDILLTIRVLKQKEDGNLNERIYGSLKTGGLMTITAIVAVGTVLVFTNSDVLFQIMLILFIGLFVDLMTTWVQNVSILRWHLARLEEKHGKGVDA